LGATVFDGWSPDRWSLVVRDGRLDGEVRYVAGGQSELMVVGVSGGLAVVDASQGVSAEALDGADRTRRLWTVRFDGAPATFIASNEIGQRLVDAALVLVAADALGGAQQCLDMSVEYAKHREQFGVVIGRFQALKHQLANMALEVEPARALVWYAAYAWDLELPDAARVAAHAKAHVCDRFVSVARAAVQAHGGIGYTWDCDLQIWFKRSIYDRAWLGSPSAHRERVATLAGW
jgi:alkylation response protein AidB-like acyl-CoA dehydrogenase